MGSTRTPTSLRSRWNRALAALFAVVVVAGIANVTVTRVVTHSFGQAAVRVEREATLLARLRAGLADHASLAHGVLDGFPVDEGVLAATVARTRADFHQAVSLSVTAGGRRLFQEGFDQWRAIVAAARPPDPSTPLAHRLQEHRDLVDGSAGVVALIERGGATDNAAIRADLARTAGVERAGMTVRVGLSLLVSVLVFRFARRLSTEVIGPVGELRASANRLAGGELDHRVEINRSDELADLAASFNAMADAIAGSQRSLIRQANQDSVTGLANRAAFKTRLAAALARPERRKGTQAVLFVDLDDFKDVNDTLGHAAGDEVLTVVAARLADVVRPGDLVARLGGDEFALLLDDLPGSDVAFAVAERAIVSLAAPVEVMGTRMQVGASIGLAMRDDDSDPESLMREADMAMYTAKGRGKNRVERYDAALHDTVVEPSPPGGVFTPMKRIMSPIPRH